MNPEVISIGDVTTDVLISVPTYPKLGHDVNALKLEMDLGGSAANFAVAMTRLGISSGLIGKVGDDWFGNFAISGLKKEGVDVSHIAVEKGAGSGMVVSVIDRNGERTMFSYRGANVRLKPNEIDPQYIRKAKLLHISGYTLVQSPQREAALKCAQLAKESGILISFDPGPLIHLAKPSAVRRILRLTDVLLPNSNEIRSLFKSRDISRCVKTLLNAGPTIIGLKLGKRGCLIARGDVRIRIPAFKVKVVDTTGAGDAWGAGFMAALLQAPANLERAGKFANAAAALLIGKEGARAPLPGRREVEDFLVKYGDDA